MKDWKVLLVDDEVEFVSTLEQRLRLRGIDVSSAYDGTQALVKINESKPHLIVLDVKMPGIGGLELLKRIKKEEPEIRVIILTGHGEAECEIEGKKLGAYECLSKPLAIDVLIAKMRKALENPESNRTSGNAE
ncbi:response regulator [Thermodesulfobacteriota bacterium]